MRSNRYGLRGLKGVQLERGLIYFWIPPKALLKAGAFHSVTLGPDFRSAVGRAVEWNKKLEAYRLSIDGPKPTLGAIIPGTTAHLVRTFEASPKFTRYSLRTQQDYANIYRRLEVQAFGSYEMFGNIMVANVTKRLSHEVYEYYIENCGVDSANKTITAWQAAFKYGALKFPDITSNPFSNLGKEKPGPRRQRWTDEQLERFIAKADEMGCPSVGRCALMCMELMQRPGDILSLQWSAYRERQDAWCILQSKCSVEVWVPSTQRLRAALLPVKRQLGAKLNGDIADQFVCPTVTGKRWHRRNFTKAARCVARAAELPDSLQIRDLRRTAATEGACAGATAAEMMAVGGWQNQASIRPYLVETLGQAVAFQSKREAYRKQMGAQEARSVSRK
jgi:integrase